MGATLKAPRAVVDTNVFVSALLFSGESSRLLRLWQKGSFVFLLTKSILTEYLRVLAYPKFDLAESEIRSLVEEELLPFVETVAEKTISVPKLKDRSDEKFLIAALSGRAQFLVTGDLELQKLGTIGACLIVAPRNFLKANPPRPEI